MSDEIEFQRKRPSRSAVPLDNRLLVSRGDAAALLSISPRALDYLIAKKQLKARRIGARVLIATDELRRFSQVDHPRSLAG